MGPKLRLLYLNESEYWNADILRVAGRIAALYLYDVRRHVYCCELTASYELILVGYLTEHYVSDAMQMVMRQATEVDSISYLHASQVDRFPGIHRRPGFRDIDPFISGHMPSTITLPGPFPNHHDQAIEEMLEYLHCHGYTTT